MVQNPVISDPELNIQVKSQVLFHIKGRGKQKLKNLHASQEDWKNDRANPVHGNTIDS